MDARFEIIETLGTGGMATVHRARDTVLGRQVAVKRLLPHLADDPAAAERFQREAQAAAALNHPGIVTIYDTGADDTGPYIVMELIEGENLASMVARLGPLEPGTTARIIRDAGQALDHAHAHGIIHRDVKPSNIIIGDGGQARLTDFGIARAVGDPTEITKTGELVGTLAYVAPETLSGAKATSASDIYSLGAVAYNVLTGRAPFGASNIGALLAQVKEQSPDPMGAEVPSEMAAAVMAALDKDPTRRPKTAGDLAASLVAGTTLPATAGVALAASAEPAADGEPTMVLAPEDPPSRQRRRLGWPLGILGLLVVVLGLVALSSRDEPRAGAIGTSTTMSATTVAAPSTTTSPPTTTTSDPTSSSIAADSPEAIATAILALLDEMRPPEVKPKEVRDIEDRLDEILEKAEDEDPEQLAKAFEKALDKVGKLEEEVLQRSELRDRFVALAEAYGLDVDRDGVQGD